MSKSNDEGSDRIHDRRRVLWIADEDIEAARRVLSLLDDREAAPEGTARPHRRLILDRARACLSQRQRRLDILGEHFSADPPFTLLLTLYVSEEREPAMGQTRLNRLSALTPSTALRWLDELRLDGWIDRRKRSYRNVAISLTQKARSAMDELFGWPDE